MANRDLRLPGQQDEKGLRARGDLSPAHLSARGSWVPAALVHVFTASGSFCALLAMLAVMEGAYAKAFAWLGVALVIDGVDGTLARRVDVVRRLPRFSGERLDVVIDYVTYVFVPAVALVHSGILGGWFGAGLGGLIAMSSLFHFADNASKTKDHCFVGFPAVWNIVAFYLFAFRLPDWAAAGAVLLCVGLTFVPMRWLHPMRVERLVWVNIAGSVLWLAAAAQTLLTGFVPVGWAAWVLGLVGAYALGLTLSWPLAHSAHTTKGKA